MEKDAAGYPQGHTNPGTSRTSPAAYPTCKSGSEGGGWKRDAAGSPSLLGIRSHEPRHKPFPRQPPTLLHSRQPTQEGVPFSASRPDRCKSVLYRALHGGVNIGWAMRT